MPAGKAPKKTAGKHPTLKQLAKPDYEWFTHDRFGMFIHWGTYAMAARHEWVKSRERIGDREYNKYFKLFDPDLYDPAEWARAARYAGMKYFVITTKHHEGFCLWDSKYTDYKATNTPCGRDLIGPMVRAFRAEGLRVGFYHSLLDWHHPQYPPDRHHPMRDNEAWRRRAAKRDITKYAEYLHNQVRELLTEFGRVDYIFFDFSVRGDEPKGRNEWQSEKLVRMCRELQPGILINDRLDLRDVPGGWDFLTPEQHMENEWPTRDGKKVPWETNQTFSGSWGYHRDETTWKSVPQLLFLLIDTVSKGGNLLLNVGPTARGTLDDRALARLAGMGDWMKLHCRGIHGCTQAPEKIPVPQDARLTWNPKTKRLYVHFLNWPIREFHLRGMSGKVKYAQLLNDASEIGYRDPADEHPGSSRTPAGAITLQLPVRKPENVAIPVVELFLR